MNKYQQLVKNRDIEEYDIFKDIVPTIPDLRLKNIQSKTGRLSLSPWDPWKALYEELLTLDESQSRGNLFDSDFLFYVTNYDLNNKINEESNNLRNRLFKEKKLVEEFFYTYPTLSWILMVKYQGARQLSVYVGGDQLDQLLNLKLNKDEVSNLLLFVGDLIIGNEILTTFNFSDQVYEDILNQAILLNVLPYFRIQNNIYFENKYNEINMLVRLNRLEIVTIILQRDIAFKDMDLDTVQLLMDAAEYGKVEIIDTLIKHNKLVTADFLQYTSVLEKALQYNKLNVIKYIVDYGFELMPNHKCFYLRESLKNYNEEMFQFFLVKVPGPFDQCSDLMDKAIQIGALSIVKNLLKGGVNPYNKTGTLKIMVHNREPIIIEKNYLIDSRIDFNIFKFFADNYENFKFDETLYAVSRYENTQILEYLLENFIFDKNILWLARSIAHQYENNDVNIINSYLNKLILSQ